MRERPTLGEAVAAFLDQPDLASSSRRSYAQTLGHLQAVLGKGRLVDRLGARELERAAWEAWGRTAPATWNRHVATVRSFHRLQRAPWLAGGRDRLRGLSAGASPPTARGRSPTPSWSGCGAAMMSRCARRRCGGCRMRPRRGRRRSSRSTGSRPGQPPRPAALQGRRHRLAAPADRLGAPAPAAGGRPRPRPAVLGRPAPRPGPGARCRGLVFVHRPGAAVLPSRRGAVQHGVGRMDASSAASTPRSPISPRPTSPCRC